MKIIISIALCLFSFNLFAVNLLTNPDAETADPTSSGWTLVSSGTNCFTSSGWRILESQNGFPAAKTGSYFFFAGCDSDGEIYQDVMVTSNAVSIDAGLQTFTFSGYTRSYNQSNPDGATIIVEYRNAANNAVLASYTTTMTHNTSGWVAYNNTKTAPAGTRRIRIRLLATLTTGGSNDGYFDDLSLTTNIPLPIQLNNFDAQQKENKVEINWSTASESNNDFFTIERSSDAINWVAIKKVNGSTTNSNTILNYTEWDYTPVTGKVYYRLRQTDVDSSSVVSTVLTVNNINASQIIISPQPASDMLEINTGTTEDIEIELNNSYGQTVQLIRGIQNPSTQIDVSNLETGIYYINIANNRLKETRKILISK